MGNRLDVRVLGPIEVWSDGSLIPIKGRQHRLILGILALEANKLVSFDRMVDLLWQERLPQRPRSVLHSRVSELRAALGDALSPEGGASLVTLDGGYVLQTTPETVDWIRFCQLVENWRSLDESVAREALRAAKDLWRGPALGGGVTDEAYRSYCIRLESARLTSVEDLFQLELGAGRHVDIVDEVVGLASTNPMRERLLVIAMTALHATGRAVEALQMYHRTRNWLIEELGIEPDHSAREVYLHILRNYPSLGPAKADPIGTIPAGSLAAPPPPSPDPETERAKGARRPTVVPHMLPPRAPDFVGRSREIEVLIEQLWRPSSGPAVIAVVGRGGIGKTALCTEVAHRVREEYPDGQLFVNLRAFDARDPLPPGEALGRLLRSLGVDGVDLPDTLDERADYYRQLTADRRYLVVLDNAADDDQVAPLLPSGHRCAVLVSSRMNVGASLGATALNLTSLDPATAVDLMARIAGPSRLRSDPGATAELTNLCGNLPLAIRIVAGKLAARPHWEVRDLTSQLRDERRRLDHLRYGSLDVKASITLSFQSLSDEAKRLYAVLGDLDPPEISRWLAAALLDGSWSRAGELLEELVEAKLIDSAGRDPHDDLRYRMHDLIRLFARERAFVDVDPAERAGARHRVSCALLTILETIVRHWPGLEDYEVTPRSNHIRPVPSEHLDVIPRNPLDWFETERPVVSTIIRRACEDDPGELGWMLASAASPLFRARRYFDDWQRALEPALDQAQRAGDHAVSEMLRRRASLLVDRREFDEALACFQEAAQLAEGTGDRHGAAVATAGLAMVERFREHHSLALNYYEQALSVLSELGDHRGRAFVLRGVGQIHLERGSHDEADTYLERSRQLYERERNLLGEAAATFWKGMLRLRQQRPEEATALFERVLGVTRELGEVAGQAQALRGLGLAYRDIGRIVEARRTLRKAHELVTTVGVSLLGEYIRRDLEDLDRRDDREPAV